MQHSIEHKEEGDGGGWFITTNGHHIAEMTYTRRENLLVMKHTWVDDSLRGQGVARKLLDEAVRYARAHGLKMQPDCPYVRSQFDKDASLADLRSGD